MQWISNLKSVFLLLDMPNDIDSMINTTNGLHYEKNIYFIRNVPYCYPSFLSFFFLVDVGVSAKMHPNMLHGPVYVWVAAEGTCRFRSKQMGTEKETEPLLWVLSCWVGDLGFVSDIHKHTRNHMHTHTKMC